MRQHPDHQAQQVLGHQQEDVERHRGVGRAVNIFCLSPMREASAALDVGTFGQFRGQFKVERVRGVGVARHSFDGDLRG